MKCIFFILKPFALQITTYFVIINHIFFFIYFQELVDLSRVTLCRGAFRQHLLSAFEEMVELTQDFTDSAYTPHEHREKILLLCDRTKLELNQLLRLGICLVSLQITLQYIAMKSKVKIEKEEQVCFP